MTLLSKEDLAQLREWLQSRHGLRASDYREAFLTRRVTPRMAARGCVDVASYLRLLDSDPAESRVLLGKVLVPTTEFMRNPEVFQSLLALIRSRAGLPGWDRLRILSAPCSTGEEAVSLALLLEDGRIDGLVAAGDRSPLALARLKAGSFPLRALDKLDKTLKERYFTLEGDRARVAPEVLRRIHPMRVDLGWGLAGRGFHVVLMRNLFIYLTEAAQGRLLSDIAEAIVPGGLLVLGRVEAVGRRWRDAWRPVDSDCRIYEWTGVRA